VVTLIIALVVPPGLELNMAREYMPVLLGLPVGIIVLFEGIWAILVRKYWNRHD
jgi:ABC-type antimicrobial peptide transport system permease subunit